MFTRSVAVGPAGLAEGGWECEFLAVAAGEMPNAAHVSSFSDAGAGEAGCPDGFVDGGCEVIACPSGPVSLAGDLTALRGFLSFYEMIEPRCGDDDDDLYEDEDDEDDEDDEFFPEDEEFDDDDDDDDDVEELDDEED